MAAADTHGAAPHVAGVGQRLLLVELEHEHHLGVVGVALAVLVGEAAHSPHGGNRLLCHLVGLGERRLHLFGQFLEKYNRKIHLM